MNAKSIAYVLQQMGVETAQMSGEWVRCSCPLAPWKHAGGTDSRPSFGVREDKGISGVHCFACGFSGGLLSLVWEYGRHAIEERIWTVEDMKQLEDFVILAEDEDVVEPPTRVPSSQVVIDEKLRDCLNRMHPYFESRGIDEDTVGRWELGYVEEYVDEETGYDMVQRVLFPVYERKEKLLSLRGIVGRTYVDEEPKYKNVPPRFPKSEYLYGAWLIEDQRRIVVVEGPIDCVVLNQRLIEAGMGEEFFAVALLGASPSKVQMSMLCDMSDEVVCMLDNDPSGRLGTQKLIDGLDALVVVSVVDWPDDVKDPDDVGADVVSMIQNRMSVLQHRLSRLLDA